MLGGWNTPTAWKAEAATWWIVSTQLRVLRVRAATDRSRDRRVPASHARRSLHAATSRREAWGPRDPSRAEAPLPRLRHRPVSGRAPPRGGSCLRCLTFAPGRYTAPSKALRTAKEGSAHAFTNGDKAERLARWSPSRMLTSRTSRWCWTRVRRQLPGRRHSRLAAVFLPSGIRGTFSVWDISSIVRTDPSPGALAIEGLMAVATRSRSGGRSTLTVGSAANWLALTVASGWIQPLDRSRSRFGPLGGLTAVYDLPRKRGWIIKAYSPLAYSRPSVTFL